MKIKISTDEFQKAISTVERIVPSRSTVSMLSCVHITAKDNRIIFTATDLDTIVEAESHAQVDEEGSALVPCKLLSSVIKKMPAGDVSAAAEKDKFYIKAGSFDMTLMAMDGYDFPSISDANDPTFEIPQKEFRNAIKRTIYATAGEDTSRPILNGILIEQKNNTVNFVALDGFRISWVSREYAGKEFSVIVPRKILGEIAKLTTDTDDPIKMYVFPSKVIFKADNFRIQSKLYAGTFIDYKKIIESAACNINFNVIVPDLLSAIERAMIVSEGKNNKIKLTIEQDNIKIYAESENAKIIDTVPCKNMIEGFSGHLDIAFNGTFLSEALKEQETPKVKISAGNDSASAMIIRSQGQDEYINFILPIKLANDN